MNVKEYVLLTGAGFTHNFGAPLAADIWALVFSHPDVRQQPKVRNLLRNQFDFEDVYHKVMTGDFGPDDRKAMVKAIEDVYWYIDSIVQNNAFNRNTPNIHLVQEFLNAFSGSPGQPGFIFTLNQDLFLERRFYNGTRPALPYVRVNPDWFTSNISSSGSSFEIQATVPADISPSLSNIGSDSLYYVKLHGSSNWYHPGGTRPIVIGRGKETQIAEDVLLAFYSDLFRKVLVGGTKRVLCTGYSFRDSHVNDVLADAVDSGIEIFFLGPGSAESTASHIKQSHRGKEIWNGLAGYFPFDLITLFPPDQRKTEEWNFVLYQFFG